MTGSRRHDILGKKENNLSNIRTLYRFENREELMHAEADQIVVTTTELLDVIWNHRSEKCRILWKSTKTCEEIWVVCKLKSNI